MLFRSAESWAYVYIYENFRLYNLPWNSPITWYLAALGVDFCYYWVHRACHGKKYCRSVQMKGTHVILILEVHILWAQHQVHHSSEEFNLAVGLRQSILHGWCGFVSIFIKLIILLCGYTGSLLIEYFRDIEPV